MIYFDPMKYLPNAETFTRMLEVVQSQTDFHKRVQQPPEMIGVLKPYL